MIDGNIKHRSTEKLMEMQSWPLEKKIEFSIARIAEFYNRCNGKIYVSFSGGKDSTVLLHLVRRLYPDTPAVFCDTGLEYPEVREFALRQENVDVIYPVVWDNHKKTYNRVSFRQIIQEEGYPVISKEIAKTIREARKYDGEKYKYSVEKLNGTKLDKEGKISKYNCHKWKFMLDAPFKISERCCDRMKKGPFKKYEHETGRGGILGVMAHEGIIRKQKWIQFGCNVYSAKRNQSKPLSFWTDQDILAYITKYKLEIPDVYGDIVINSETGKLATTGLDRTGCMFCMFGVHMEKEPNRFQKMKITHRKIWDYCMRPLEMGGLGLKKVLDYVGIKYE